MARYRDSETKGYEMKQLFIFHGALLRKSTFMWSRALSDHFMEYGFSCYRFFWSGIPLPFLIRNARSSFIKFYNKRVERGGVTYIYAKSLGADIFNSNYNSLIVQPKRILFVGPAFRLSTKVEFHVNSELFNVKLTHDRFVSKWERYGIVHRLDLPGITYTIMNDETFDHHELNWNSRVPLEELGSTQLYDLYDRIFEVRPWQEQES